jgi:hypothetical protein
MWGQPSWQYFGLFSRPFLLFIAESSVAWAVFGAADRTTAYPAVQFKSVAVPGLPWVNNMSEVEFDHEEWDSEP